MHADGCIGVQEPLEEDQIWIPSLILVSYVDVVGGEKQLSPGDVVGLLNDFVQTVQTSLGLFVCRPNIDAYRLRTYS